MRGRILLIEGDDELGATIEQLLASAGHEVERTPSGRAGLMLAADARWDVVLLGLRSQEVAGKAVARVVGDLWGAALVVMSARPVEDWRCDAFDAGATACLSKPFDPRALLLLMDALLAGAARGVDLPGDVRALRAEDLERISRMSDDELDALPFGLMRIDSAGAITAYNAFEGRVAGFVPSTIVGRSLRELAPCTMVQEFIDAVEQGFEDQRLDRVLRFVFPVHQASCVVNVRLYYDESSAQMWLFVTRRNVGPP